MGCLEALGAKQRMDTAGCWGRNSRVGWEIGLCFAEFVDVIVPECVEHTTHDLVGREREK